MIVLNIFYTQDDPNTSPVPMIFWKYSVGGTTVEFNGVPFSIGGKRTMDCQYGHQYYKQRVASNKRVRLQGTRKVGCTAHITQREYTLYPEFNCVTKFIIARNNWTRTLIFRICLRARTRINQWLTLGSSF